MPWPPDTALANFAARVRDDPNLAPEWSDRMAGRADEARRHASEAFERPEPERQPDIPPPHRYVPAGPVEESPELGFHPPQVRREAFEAVLDGVTLGTYDRLVINWLMQLDDTTCRTIASIMWRCRLSPPLASAAIRLLEEALLLRMYGERPPGGSENWHDWERKAERFLPSLLTAGAEPSVDGPEP